jgi:hypothetical protein
MRPIALANRLPLAAAGLACLCAAPAVHALADLGPGGLFLDVSGSLTYDSNIFGRSAETDDWIATLAPALSYVQDRGLVHMTATAATSFNEFNDNSRQSGTDFTFGLNLTGMHREPAPPMSFSFGATYRDETLVIEEVGDRSDVTDYSLNGSVDFDVSEKTGLRFSAGYGERDFDNSVYSDSEDYNGRADFLYKYSEKLSLRTGYRYREINQDTFDYSTDTLIVGAEGVLSPKLSGSAELGISEDDRTSGSELYYSLGLGWTADQNTSFSLNGSRDYSPSVVGARATSTNLSLGVSQRLTDSLSGNGSIGFGQFERDGIDPRDDDIFRLGAGLSLRVGDNSSVSASAAYTDRSSNSGFSDYERIRVSFTGAIRF